MNYYKNIEELLSLKLLKEVSHLVNDKSKIELVKIIKKYTKKDLKNRIINIATFIKYNVSSEVSWCDRIFLIKNVLKNDSSSLKSFIIRYGEKDGEKLFSIKNNKTKPILDCSNITEWKKRYENVGESLDKYIKLYGEKNGVVKWNEYKKKRKCTYKNNKTNGKIYLNGRTLNEYISRYGKDVGKKKYEIRNNKQKYRFSVDYYIEKYGFELGNEKWNNYRKTMIKTTLKSYISRYGKEVGKKKYELFIKNLKYNNSLDFFIKKYGIENGENKWNEYRNKTIFKKQKYSKISQELFWYVYDILNEKQKKFVYFAEKNSEYFFRKNKTIIFADFKLKNIIVEFDGEYWHSSKESKIRDKIKDNIYYENNCFLLRINERDYLNNKNNVINTVVEFINKNIKYD